MKKKHVMKLLANILDEKLIFIDTENCKVMLNPSDTKITFDKDMLELKSFYADVTLQYDSIIEINIEN